MREAFDAPRHVTAPGRRSGLGRGRVRLIAAGILAVALVAGWAWLAYGESDRLPRRVSVGTIDAGGLTAAEAGRRIRKEGARLARRPVVLVLPNRRLDLTAAQLGATPPVGVAVEWARAARGRFGRALARIGLTKRRHLDLALRADPRVVESIGGALAASYDRAPRDAAVRGSASGLALVPARPGRRLDTRRLRELLAEASGTVVVPFSTVRPVLDTAAARRALEVAVRLVGEPLVVDAGDARATVPPSVIRRALRFTPTGRRLAVTVDPDVVAPPLEAALGHLEQPPLDAVFRVVGDRVVVDPARVGRRLDIAGMTAAAAKSPGSQVQARFAATQPALTTAKARAMGVVEPVAEFTTPFACCPPRVTNIRLGAEILDGQVIPAGGSFSLNAALGRRTRERGFVPAPMILSGRLVDSVGGGVSQIAATLYSAAFFAGLDLVEHTPHEFFISRYPLGREATISWQSPDLVIRNAWPAAVLVDASVGSGSITIRLFSSKLGRRVETETGAPYAFRPARKRFVELPTLPPGKRQIAQVGGFNGFAVDYTRRVYRDDRLTAKERFTTRYRPEDTIVEVGPPIPPKAQPNTAPALLAVGFG